MSKWCTSLPNASAYAEDGCRRVRRQLERLHLLPAVVARSEANLHDAFVDGALVLEAL